MNVTRSLLIGGGLLTLAVSCPAQANADTNANARDPTIHARLPEIEFLQGDVTNALKSLELAGHLAQEAPEPVEYELELALGDAYNLSGDLPTALQHYHRLLAGAEDAQLSEARLRVVREKVQALERRSEPVPVEAVQPRVYSAGELESALKERLTPDELAQVVNPIECTPQMAHRARQIVGDTPGDLARARKLFDQLVSRPYTGLGSTHTAQEVFTSWDDLSQPFGCQEYAKLFVALARSVDLPAYFAHVQRDYSGAIVNRNCAAVFVEGKAWLVDPACEWFGVPHRDFRILDDLQSVAHHSFQPHDGEVEVAVCRAGLKLDPDYVWGRMCLVVALIESGQFNEARKELTEVRRAHPEHWKGYQLEGLLACKQNRYNEGVEWLLKAREANPGSGDTRIMLAEALFRTGVQASAREEFLAGLRREHRQDNEDLARRRLGVLDEVLRPQTDATDRMEPAADAVAYYELGLSLLSGSTPDAAEAIKWIRKAADMGFTGAQGTLGAMYWNGQGVSQDFVTAVEWWQKAADRGDSQAMRNLASAYELGAGVEQNLHEALRWLRKAAEAGDPGAQMLLGKAYYRGKALPRNLAEALFWLKLAAEAKTAEGSVPIGQIHPVQLMQETRSLVKEVELFATPEEIAEASARLESYRARKAEESVKQSMESR